MNGFAGEILPMIERYVDKLSLLVDLGSFGRFLRVIETSDVLLTFVIDWTADGILQDTCPLQDHEGQQLLRDFPVFANLLQAAVANNANSTLGSDETPPGPDAMEE